MFFSGQSNNQHFYCKLFAVSEGAICRKCPEQQQNRDSLDHHNNTMAHTALSKQQYLAAKSMAVVPHPHLLHLAPCDFFLFMRIKLQVLRSKFLDVPEIWEQLLTAQLAVP